MRIVFFGTPAFAVPTLTEIIGQGHQVVAVYTQPPRPAGRGMAERRSPIHEVADRFSIPVRTPPSLKGSAAATEFATRAPDIGVVVAYGQILPPAFLDAPAHGCLNLHASNLPRWRGAAPIARAIMTGDIETGVMVMRMEAGLDTGPVAMSERITIDADATAGELSGQLATLGADLMARALAAVSRGVLTFIPQAGEATYARKIDKAETRIDWSRPARDIHNHIRGLSPDPGAWFEIDLGGGPQRIKVLRSTLASGSGQPGVTIDDKLTVACGDGAVRLLNLHRAGKGPLPAADFLRGSPIAANTRLG